MTKKELLYAKLGALRLEVDSSIVDDIVAAANDAFQEQYLQQCNVNGSLPCHHNFIQKDTYWKSCTHCGMLAPLGQ